MINGTEINYFFVCKRKLFLFHHKLYQEQNSQLVKLGKLEHEDKFFDENSEIALDGIKVDKIDGDFLVEHKRSKADMKAGEWQLIYYLYRFAEVGIYKKGRLTFGKKGEIYKEFELTEKMISDLKEHLLNIEILLNSEKVPPVINHSKCKKCAYFDFCYV